MMNAILKFLKPRVLNYRTCEARQTFAVDPRIVKRWALALIAAVAMVVAILLVFSRLNHRLVIVNRSGIATERLRVDVNGRAMIARALAAGEKREWYGSSEGLPVASTGTVRINGSLSDGTEVNAVCPYKFGNGFWNYESRVVIGKDGSVSFEP